MNHKNTHNRALTILLQGLHKIGLEPIITLSTVQSKELGLRLEEKLIKEHGRIGKDPNGILCNRCTVGSDNTGAGHFSRSRPQEVRDKIAAGHLGKSKPKLSDAHKNSISKALTNKIRSKEHCDNLAKSILGKSPRKYARAIFSIQGPNNIVHTVNGDLDKFCRDRDLNRQSLYRSLKLQRPVLFGKTKGWQLLAVQTKGGIK